MPIFGTPRGVSVLADWDPHTPYNIHIIMIIIKVIV